MCGGYCGNHHTTTFFTIQNCWIFSVQHVYALFNVLTINSEYFPKQHELGLVTPGSRNFKVWKIREMCSIVNNNVNVCLLPWNFHFCMKGLVIAFCGCLSECIDCSLVKNEDRMWAENPVLLSSHYKTNTTAVILGEGCSSGSHLDIWVSGVLRGM